MDECATCGLCFCEFMESGERPCAFCLICGDIHDQLENGANRTLRIVEAS